MAQEIIVGWKAFRMDCGRFYFLYHTHNGSSLVPVNEWLVTKQKWVHNPGSGKHKKFRSGFHFFKDRESVKKFNSMTNNKYVIKEILAKGIWKKPRTTVGSYLAKSIFIT